MGLFDGLQTMFGVETQTTRGRMVQKDDRSIRHEKELKKQNIQLKEQLDEANERVIRLENQMNRTKEETAMAEKEIETKRDDIDQLIVGVSVQIQEMIDSLDQQMSQLEFKTDRQIRELGELSTEHISDLKSTSEQITKIHEAVEPVKDIQESVQKIEDIKALLERMEEQNLTLAQLSEVTDAMKTELIDRIHSENVKCFRNMKSLVKDLEQKVEEIEISENSLKKIRRSFKGMKLFVVLDFVIIVGWILYSLGFIQF